MSGRRDTDKEQLPSRYGRFEVTGVLGRGGMGIVYLAKDPVIGREVAIKVLRPDHSLSSEEREGLKARFEQEFRSAGTLSHPNIVTIYDVGQEDEHSFIAMEYVAGQSLSDLMSSGQELSFRKIADLAMQIAGGLDYAHERGVVHRDVKPANILITGEGRPKVTDFGVAKVVSTTLTRTGTVIGTPAYMSPEQVVGQSVTGGSDQFSMAIILYQLLTGELPFAGDNPTTILYKIVHEDPAGPHRLNPVLPEAVDAALLRALSKAPGDRYASCTELAQVLSEALGAAPEFSAESTEKTVTLSQVSLGQGSGTYGGVASWWQRQAPAPRIGIFAFAAVVALGLGWWTFDRLAGGPDSLEKPLPATRVADAPQEFRATLRVTTDGGRGTSIWKNGEDTGLETPADVILQGTVGSVVRLELRRDQKVLAETTRTLSPDMDSTWHGVIPLEPETYAVSSDPPGASILLGGKASGLTTPAEITLVPGERYNLTVQLDGYEPRSYAFRFPDELRDGERANRNLRFRLRSAVAPGQLVIEAPYAVIVEVGGQRAGPTARHEIPLPPNTYDIKLSAPDVFFEQHWRGITIDSDQRRELSVPPAIPVRVIAVPGNCRVSIDGRYVDEPPFDQLLSVGNHLFRFEWPLEGKFKSQPERITPRTQQIVGTLQ